MLQECCYYSSTAGWDRGRVVVLGGSQWLGGLFRVIRRLPW